MASTSARRDAWTERHPAAAAELRAIMEDAEADARQRRRAAGLASAATRTGMFDHLRARALRRAETVRGERPDASLRTLAAEIAATLGPSARSPRTIRRWAAEWGKSGRLGHKGRCRPTPPREVCLMGRR